jgi:hypothetical protein
LKFLNFKYIKRDSLYHGLSDNVKSQLHHFDPIKREAARKVEIILEHYDEAAKRPGVHMQSIRKEVDKVFRSILDLFEALVQVNGADTNKAFIAELNVVMERYKDILAQEAGHGYPEGILPQGRQGNQKPVAWQGLRRVL